MMNQDDFAELLEMKQRLFAAEEIHLDKRALRRFHRKLALNLFRFGPRLGLSPAQIAELAAPQGGGTPKTKEQVEAAEQEDGG